MYIVFACIAIPISRYNCFLDMQLLTVYYHNVDSTG